MLLLFDLWGESRKGKMTAYSIVIFMQSFIKFQEMIQEIQMKRPKRDLHTY